jgi:hypothetical protein
MKPAPVSLEAEFSRLYHGKSGDPEQIFIVLRMRTTRSPGLRGKRCHYTDGMTLSAGTSIPSSVGGQGTDMK